MGLHQRVMFVGDKPNPKKNVSMDVAFVGTTSYKTLLDWVYKMDLDLNLVSMLNAYDVQGQPQVLPSDIRKYKVIALGEECVSVLNKVPGLVFFKLPHPSGLNKSLNNKKQLSERLVKCRKWIYEG